jgi:MFS family permease
MASSTRANRAATAATRQTDTEPALGTFSALRQREFGLLWWSGVGQAIGLGMQQITLGHFVYERTNDEFWVGAVAFMGFIPFFAFSLFAGAIGDRMDRRVLLLIAQAMSGLAVLLLAILIVTDLVANWHILVASFVAATGQALTVPIRFAYVNELVERRYLMNAVALNSLAQNGMRVIGPVIAGLLIAAISDGGTMFINAAGYLIGLVPLLMLRSRPRPALVAGVSVLQNIREGVRFALTTPVIMFGLLLSNFGFSLFGMTYISMMPVFAKDVLDSGSLGLGILSGAAGIGSVLGGLALARLGDYPHKRRLYTGFYVLFFAALTAFSLSPNFYLSLAIITLVGLGSISHISMGTVIIQTATPQALQGRVMSLWTWGICLNFLGALPVGALAHFYGAPAVMAVSAVLGLLFGLFLMARYRRVPLVVAA